MAGEPKKISARLKLETYGDPFNFSETKSGQEFLATEAGYRQYMDWCGEQWVRLTARVEPEPKDDAQ